MAQIIIREKDLTGNPASTTFDVAFVPGLTKSKPTDEGIRWEYNKPYYVDSVSTFRKQFGSEPVQLTGDGIPYNYSETDGIETDKKLEGTIGDDTEYITVACGQGNTPLAASDISSSIGASSTVSFKDVQVVIGDVKAGDTVTVVINDQATEVVLTNVQQGTGAQFSGELLPGSEVAGKVATLQVNANADLTITWADGDGTIADIVAGLTATISGTVVFDAEPDGYFFKGGEGVFDNGYIYAVELLSAGIPIYYCPIEGTEARKVYDALNGDGMQSILNQLADRGTFNIKYITSGGYPTFEYNNNSIVSLMLSIAGALSDDEPTTDDYKDDPATNPPSNGRGDAVAFIDHFELDARPLYGDVDSTSNASVYQAVNHKLSDKPCLSFGAMFTPYANYSLQNTYTYDSTTSGKTERVTSHYFPASFAYLTCLARQLNSTLPSYEAIAGVARGSVKNIIFDAETNSYEVCTKDVLTNYIANHYNSMPEADGSRIISINGITQINPYGLVIYGTRTLAKKDPVEGVKATGILNIRNMVSDIKKQMYQSARRYMYSANNDALWINFRSSVVGLLNQMQQGYGIKSWSLKKDMAKSTKSSLYVLCSIQPVYPVEKFDITIEITDEDVEVNEA